MRKPPAISVGMAGLCVPSMKELIAFLGEFEIWIYAILGAIALLYLRRVFVAWNEWRTAVFGLEKETSQRKLSTGLTVLSLAALMGLSVFVLVTFVSPALPAVTALPTPTLDLLATTTPTSPVIAAEGSAEAASTPAPNAVNVPLSEGCQPGRIEWVAPLPGADVSGTVTLQFIVNLDNLGFYKYEFGQPGSDNWTSISAGNVSSENEQTAIWFVGDRVPGDYLLRLVAFDGQENAYPICVTSVRVVAQE